MELDTSRDFLDSESDVEIRTGERGRMDDVALYYRVQIGKCPLLTPDEEFLYTTSYFENKDPSIMELLINHNLRIVCSRAKRFLWSNLPLSDLIQEGTIGLMTAIEKFEPVRGFRLSTFAVHSIDNMIRRYVQENASQIWVPRKVQTLNQKIKMRMKLAKGSQSEKEKQVALELGISVEELQETVIASSFDFTSLNSPVRDDGTSTLEDSLMDSLHSNPFEVILVRSELRQTLEEKAYVYGILSGSKLLKKRDVEIFLARTGLVGVKKPLTFDSLAVKYNLSRQAVDQIVRRIYLKLARQDPKITKDYLDDLVRKTDALRAIVETF